MKIATNERTNPGEEGYLGHEARYFLAKMISTNKNRILDIGCGYGYGTAMYAEVAGEVIGVDYDKDSIEHCNNTHKRENLHFFRHDLRTGDLRKFGKFDHVNMLETIEHVSRDIAVKILHEIHDILEDNGTLIITTDNAHFRAIFSDVVVLHHEHEYELSELIETVENAGFEVVQIFGQTNLNKAGISGLLRKKIPKILSKIIFIPSLLIPEGKELLYFTMENIENSCPHFFILFRRLKP